MFHKRIRHLGGALKLSQNFPRSISNYYTLSNTKLSYCCSRLRSPHIFECFCEVTTCSKYFFTRNYVQVENSVRLLQRKNISITNNVKTNVIEEVQRIFCCETKDAQKLFNVNKQLFTDNDDIEMLIEKCKSCEDFGITKRFILSNPWVLQMTATEISKKIKLLENWKFKNLTSNFCLLELSTVQLTNYTHKIIIESSIYPPLNDSNRITYLAAKLNKEEEDISKLALKRNYLLQMKFTKLENTLEILLSNGIEPKYIFLDSWVLRYSVDDIQSRLKLLKLSMEPAELKPWMLHCRNESFQRTIQLRDENRIALGPFANDEEYLCHRLSITPEAVQELYQRHPPLRCVQTTKLKEMLDFLFYEGYTSMDICRFPRILCHSLLTIKERMDCMKSVGYRPKSLAVCCKTKKKFKEFITKLDVKKTLTNTE